MQVERGLAMEPLMVEPVALKWSESPVPMPGSVQVSGSVYPVCCVLVITELKSESFFLRTSVVIRHCEVGHIGLVRC